MGDTFFKINFSEIYSTPRLPDSLDNSVSISNNCLVNAANSLGHINSNSLNATNGNSSTNTNNGQFPQKHRIDALAQISVGTTNILSNTPSLITPSMDTVLETKSRQG